MRLCALASLCWGVISSPASQDSVELENAVRWRKLHPRLWPGAKGTRILRPDLPSVPGGVGASTGPAAAVLVYTQVSSRAHPIRLNELELRRKPCAGSSDCLVTTNTPGLRICQQRTVLISFSRCDGFSSKASQASRRERLPQFAAFPGMRRLRPRVGRGRDGRTSILSLCSSSDSVWRCASSTIYTSGHYGSMKPAS
jgi:hypothetical protein